MPLDSDMSLLFCDVPLTTITSITKKLHSNSS